jgi:hypothetical protein
MLVLLLVFLSHATKADPANVLVGDITFTPPKTWKWEQTEKSKAIRFVVPAEAGKPQFTDVRFYAEDKDTSHSDDAWKARFPDAAKTDDVREKEKEVGGRKVSYLTLRGSYIGAENKIKRDYMLISATIPWGKQVIRARILGPKTEVKAASADFKKMIEEALVEAK